MNKAKRNQIAKRYIKAASFVYGTPKFQSPEYACTAIEYTGKHPFCYTSSRMKLAFEVFFKPENRVPLTAWWNKYIRCFDTSLSLSERNGREINNPTNRHLMTTRIIALCLMAELAKDGQLDNFFL